MVRARSSPIRPAIACPAAFLAAVLLAAPCGVESHPSRRDGDAANEACTCAEALLTHGWCPACSTGTVAAVRIRSADLYDVIDAHGHTFDPGGIRCPECRTAAASDGFCEPSEIGYAKGKAYVSRLAWLLAKGAPVRPETLSCADCRSHIEVPGWCENCEVGVVGGSSYRARNLYEETLRERQRLIAASERSSTCTLCAVVLFADGRCPKCNIVYRDGAPVGGAGRGRTQGESP